MADIVKALPAVGVEVGLVDDEMSSRTVRGRADGNRTRHESGFRSIVNEKCANCHRNTPGVPCRRRSSWVAWFVICG